MKEEFVPAELEVIKLEIADILTMSLNEDEVEWDKDL